ncbi:glycosyltransferase family 4 protein [Clostridium baratii]|uniref:glycosyltransferase family 4 protein n=1 Tax=Clostridium baratii TaxID=1561 RepID=UPI001CB11FFF|nr:glycosyltransferase family 4 protein [Clostridium baratii]STA98784.1 glycosyltransferase [Clostridium baratii]
MKVLHICLAAFYIDNYSYQENMLPKYHKKLGYDVSILASLQTFDKNGNASFLKESNSYINEDGIPVKRIPYKKFMFLTIKKLKHYTGVYESIKEEKPDIIFIHGCQFSNMNDIKKYVKRNPNTKVFVDNHCDFSNSAKNWFSKNILHKVFWRYSARVIEPYTKKFYGVLPARVKFITDIYKINKNKVELLVMGADDERVEEAYNKEILSNIRKNYGIKEDDFLIVTGGKIDNFKRQTLLLMEAVNRIKDKKLKLLVFGSVTEELQDEIRNLANGDNVKYIGWIDSKDSYKYFAAADLVIFPGRHSVFWEQVVGLGKPIVVKYWSGTTHIDLGGNCKFLYQDSSNEIEDIIKKILYNKEEYEKMNKIAKIYGVNKFSYKKIAKISIQ